MFKMIHLLLVLLSSSLFFTQAQVNLPSPPTSFRNTSVGPTFITLTWSQPTQEVVSTYQITYSYTINGCTGLGSVNVMIPAVSGSLRQFNLTRVQENSDHTIRISARNNAGSSGPAQTMVTTPIAAPSAPPPNFVVNSTTFHSVYVMWDETPCQDWNVDIINYYLSIPLLSHGFIFRSSARSFNFTSFPRNNYTLRLSTSYYNTSVNPSVYIRSPPVSIIAETPVPPGLGFLLDGRLYFNNSVVSLSRINSYRYRSLYCLTPRVSCCRPQDGGSGGQWFLPGQTNPVVDRNSVAGQTANFTVTRAPSAVFLTRRNRNVTGPSGVYTCVIPDASGQNRILYIGVDTQGALTLVGLDYNRTSLTLTCTTSDRPVNTITWTRDGIEVGRKGDEFWQEQTITNHSTATYQHTLTAGNISSLVGNFTCGVVDFNGYAVIRTLNINGVSLHATPFVVSGTAMINCSYEFGVADRIEIVSGDGQLRASEASVRTLILTVNPVTDSLQHHFTCYVAVVVTRHMVAENRTFRHTITVNATVPLNAISTIVSRAERPVIGSEFTFTCTVTAVPGFTNMPTAEWRDPSGSTVVTRGDITVLISPGSRITVATLTFDPVRALHGGRYTCIGRVMTPILPKPLQDHEVEYLHAMIPPPSITFTGSPVDSNFFTGLQLNLTCSIHIPEAVGSLPLDVFAQWSRDGSALTSNSRVTVMDSPVMVDPLLYQSTVVFSSLDGARDNGVYSCTGRVNSSDSATATFTVAIHTTFFQLQLSGIDNCQSWRLDNVPAKIRDLVNALVEKVEPHCRCAFSEDRITDGVFQCFPSSPQSVTFHAQLHGTLRANVTQLLSIIKEWLSLGGTIPVQFLPLSVSSVCAVNSSTPVEDCTGEMTSSLDSISTIIIISAAALLAIIVLAITALIIVIVCLRHRRSGKSKLPSPPVQTMEMNSLAADTTHEYEDIDKYIVGTCSPPVSKLSTAATGEYSVPSGKPLGKPPSSDGYYEVLQPGGRAIVNSDNVYTKPQRTLQWHLKVK